MNIRKRILIALLLAIGIIFCLTTLSGVLVDALWFHQLQFDEIFWGVLEVKLVLFIAGFAVAFLYTWLHFRSAVVMDSEKSQDYLKVSIPGEQSVSLSRRALRWGGLLAALVISALIALYLSSNWEEYFLYRWGSAFGLSEPIYGEDVGFYIFRLQFLQLLQSAISMLTGWVLLAIALFFAGARMLRRKSEDKFSLRSRPARQLGICLALFLLNAAWGYYLDRYELLYSSEGAVYGAGFTDVNILRYMLWVMAATSIALCAVTLWGALRQNSKPVMLSCAAYFALLFIGLWLLPALVQSFYVEPNELELETPYIENNIEFTRKAFGLDRIIERDYPARERFEWDTVANNQATINNIRLWDWRPLLSTYRQLQEIRLYYKFYGVDIDRYELDGQYRQVMLSARELQDRLPERADTWVNRVLQFTHGYGLAMSLATQPDDQGVPSYVIKDLPPIGLFGVEVDRPAVYYGEGMPGYRIVNTEIKELDYPKGDDNVYTSYDGNGGIPIAPLWKRLLMAWELGDLNIVLTSYIKPDSRIQLWRQVRRRVGKIAPFLELDPDPYLITSEGRLYWMLDAYTTSSGFPYSEHYGNGFNYIRNSVKVVVDAYEGSVDFYVMDEGEPVIAAWSGAFPGVFKPFDEMPEDLKKHIRYPEELFRVQVEKLSTYHMTVPQVYYNREDLWTIPREKYAGDSIMVDPYYILMRMPDQESLEFLLMTPLTPSNKDNMIAWVAARCDRPNYGSLIVFKLPKERLIYGPLQIEAVIDQNTEISQQLSLWDQRGSQVIRGNLLVIPIESSFLYVEPVYLLAEGTDIPQLRRVIVAMGDQVAMEPTLDEAVRALFGQGTSKQKLFALPSGATQSTNELRRLINDVRRALGEGKWKEFGARMDALEKELGKAAPVEAEP